MTDFYAHTLPETDSSEWEKLSTHLEQVARRAADFGSAFSAAECCDILGRCHDLGKGSLEFQEYLKLAGEAASEEEEPQGKGGAGVSRRVDHSTFGARFVSAEMKNPLVGELLAYCIAGHHAGLADAESAEDATQRSTLRARLYDDRLLPKVICPLPQIAQPALPSLRAESTAERAFSLAFFTRMLFSCLVDADRLCTEQFCEPESAKERDATRPSLHDIIVALTGHLQRLSAHASFTPVNQVRACVLQDCRSAAEQTPGFFSLQVPTGGGKTLSSLVFAMQHAVQHEMRRVIVAIPFTSILEQTASVYRKALGALAKTGLIEHHSSLRPEHDTRRNRMLAENWDAPLVLTTNVQLFESMFAAKGTPCRKLHRLAKSVIVLDEAQTLPVELLLPTLSALRELVRNYGCTVVLCTATQPALERRDDFPGGLADVRPIVPGADAHFRALKRVEVKRLAGKQTCAAIADRMAKEPRVLAIMNTRAQAAELYERLADRVGAATCFHLSTLMCAAHRRTVLDEIRTRLQDKKICRVVSTQLVEAGVDLDFPVVFRAEAGFDAIAQAAGRCNREGSLPELGRTYVFEAEQPPPPGFLRDTAQSARELWPAHPDPLAPSAIEAYFRHHYWRSSDLLDRHQILNQFSVDLRRKRTAFQFRTVAEKYGLIQDDRFPILVPFDTAAAKFIDDLYSKRVAFVSQRTLQPYMVSIPEHAFRKLERQAAVVMHESGIGLLLRRDAYDEKRGLRTEELGLDARLWSA